MNVNFTDNSAEVLQAMELAIARALESCGNTAEYYAKKNVEKAVAIDTGNLLNHIAHEVDIERHEVYIGTNVEYAAYVELGTGKHYPGGRQGWWVYVKGGGSSGKKSKGKIYTYDEARRIMMMLRAKGLDAHMTDGQEAQPFLKPAVEEHAQTYRNIIADEMKNG